MSCHCGTLGCALNGLAIVIAKQTGTTINRGCSALRIVELLPALTFHACARDRGGECLSPWYVNNRAKLLWRCRKSHEWEATPRDIKQGTWCSTCAERPRITIEKMQALARTHGGECLSTTYVNQSTKRWRRCKEGHEWDATPGNIKAGK